jgi:hypothetical protein
MCFVAGDDDEAKEAVAQIVPDGGLRAIDVGPLERARQLEGLGFPEIPLQQPLGLYFQSAWKLISKVASKILNLATQGGGAISCPTFFLLM